MAILEDISPYLPNTSVDCVVFGYKEEQLHVLLSKWKNHNVWLLAGGFVYKNENFYNAARRILHNYTGLQDIFLKQFHTFSDQERNLAYDELFSPIISRSIDEADIDNKQEIRDWYYERYITTGYFSLVDAKKVFPRTNELTDDIQWIPIHDLPQLILDHQRIIKTALSAIKKDIHYLPVGRSLLPEKFTMNELKNLYECILQKRLDRANFQRKMLKLNYLERHEKKMTGAPNKAPYLYSFVLSKYNELLSEGIEFSL